MLNVEGCGWLPRVSRLALLACLALASHELDPAFRFRTKIHIHDSTPDSDGDVPKNIPHDGSASKSEAA